MNSCFIPDASADYATEEKQELTVACLWGLLLHKKATFHQVTTMLATSKYVLFPGHNHLLTTGTVDPSLIITIPGARAVIKVLGH